MIDEAIRGGPEALWHKRRRGDIGDVDAFNVDDVRGLVFGIEYGRRLRRNPYDMMLCYANVLLFGGCMDR